MRETQTYIFREGKHLFDGISGRQIENDEIISQSGEILSDENNAPYCEGAFGIFPSMNICIVEIYGKQKYLRKTPFIGQHFRCIDIIKILTMDRSHHRPENAFDILNTERGHYIPSWLLEYDIGIHSEGLMFETIYTMNEVDALEMRLKL